MTSGREVVVRDCELRDLNGVSEVCCRCGYGGEDIARSARFRDRRLFAMLFSHYYVRYERATAFVAVPEGDPGRVIGYIIGCADSDRYGHRFALRMVPRIAAHVLLITAWRYPQSVAELLRWGRGIPWHEANPAGERYPAHLHIDILPEYQRQGIGGMLLERLETRFAELGVEGIHLVTSNYHRTALPFYDRHGYRVLREQQHTMWSGLSDYRSIVYIKELASGGRGAKPA